MRFRLRFVVVAIVVAGLTAITSPALAAPASTTFAVRAVETAFTSTSASFSGTGTGDAGERAAWTVSITRTTFDSAGRSILTGGTFTMRTLSPNWTTDWVTGTVAGGFVQKQPGSGGCTNERFDVSVSLTGVATKTTAGGAGTFVGVLTHYRTPILGACVTYGATVTGLVALRY